MENFDFTPSSWVPENSIIKVIGVGGGGCNAVTYMFNQQVKGCNFIVCNTDSQALGRSNVPTKIQMGPGLGAGTNPTKGRNAALESQEELEKVVMGNGTKMLFITAGMGGGTGTGAAPVIAKMAKERGILTVAVVTLPFKNEGTDSFTKAIDGIRELEKNVDSLIIINNEKLYKCYGDFLVQDAFPKADEVLATAVKSITEIISRPGYINVDFEDIKALMKDSGMALMGCGSGSGENRIEDAVKNTLESPLLNDFDLATAKNVLINITVGKNEKGVTMNQLEQVNEKIKEYTGKANNFKSGLVWDESKDFGDRINITTIATGIKFNEIIGENEVELGNYINIDPDYCYDKGKLMQEGISLGNGSFIGVNNIGYNKSNSRNFHYNDEELPVLLVNPSHNIAELENTPAIRRNLKNQ